MNETSLDSDYRHLIIESPKLQTLKHRFSSSLVTLIFWVAWFYLWQPVISLLAWSVGVKMFYDHMIGLGGVKGFFQLLLIYILALVVIGLVFFSWAYYNNRRFKNKKRRGRTWKISFMNLGERYEFTGEQVLHCKASRRLVVHFDEAGKITSVGK